MLSIAKPQDSLPRLAALPIGQRDAALLALRGQLFGKELRSLERCPECDDYIELELSVDDIRVEASTSGEEPIRLETPERALCLRRLTSLDLLAVAELPTAESRKAALLNRCVQQEGADEAPKLNEEEQRAVVNRLAEADPQADIRIAMDCSQCGHAWSARFDIALLLWAEIHAWAQRMLAEVHALAVAYGWSELDILSMTPWRRQVYLEMLRQ